MRSRLGRTAAVAGRPRAVSKAELRDALWPATYVAAEILGSIGAEGMGEVYRARDPRLDRQMAPIVHENVTRSEDSGKKLLDAPE